MSEVNATGAKQAVPVRVQPASSVPANTNVTKGGKVLPQGQQDVPGDVNTKNSSEGDSYNSIQKAVADMNAYIQSTQRDLQFSIDEETGDTIVKVLDRKTQEVIRQIPDEIFLRLARQLTANEPVQLLKAQA